MQPRVRQPFLVRFQRGGVAIYAGLVRGPRRHRMESVASRTDGSQRVTLLHAHSVNAARVLLERVFMALAARLRPLDGILARGLDRALTADGS